MFVSVVASLLFVFLVSVHAQEDDAPFFPLGEDYSALTSAAPYSARFAELGFNRPLTFFLYDLTNQTFLAGIDIDKQMPVVSAIKGPILMYFCFYVPQSVWAEVPAEYWTETKAENVPENVRDTWTEHRAILNDLYRMIVYSDNVSTGNVLRYAFDYTGYDLDTAHPIQTFNLWSTSIVGVSEQSGMREWDEGGTANPAWVEHAYDNRTTLIRNVPRYYNNTYSALDLARYYHWLSTQADPILYDKVREVMSIVEGFPGFLEDAAIRLEGTPISKDGFVGPGDRGNPVEEYLTADAGLIELNDRALLVVSMGVNGGDKMDEIYLEVQTIVRRERQQLYWSPEQDFLTWIHSADGPFGANNLSTEGAYFILDYMTGLDQRPEPATVLEHQRDLFLQARAVWLAIFPDDLVPTGRTPEQARVMAARYGNSGESLHVIAVELGLVEGD